jgi:hypothetical protein
VSNTNAIIPYSEVSPEELANTIGITQFPSADAWYQTIGGLLIQGGLTSSIALNTSVLVDFNQAFNKQVLGVFVQARYTSGATNENTGMVDSILLNRFTLRNGGDAKTFYWWAIGV